MIRTADHGLQPLRWHGVQVLPGSKLIDEPRLAPIRIAAGAMGHGLPARDLTVSPQHRICIASPITRRMFGADEIFVPAKKLAGWQGIAPAPQMQRMIYHHLLFDCHEVIFANGLRCESLLLGPQAVDALGRGAMGEIEAVKAHLGRETMADTLARPCPARGPRLRQLLERHLKNGKALTLAPDAPSVVALAG